MGVKHDDDAQEPSVGEEETPQEEAAAEAPEAVEEPAEEAKEAEAEAEEEMDAWDKNEGRSSMGLFLAAIICVLLVIVTFVLTFLAEYEEGFDRSDKFHPNIVALNARHWTRYVLQFEPMGPAGPEDLRRMVCIVKETNPVPAAAVAAIQALYSEFGLTVAANQINLDDIKCTYKVPYTAIWAAMCCSFVGLAAVCVYARGVIAAPRGTDKMSNTAHIIHEAAMQFLHQEYTWLAPFVACLWIFLFVAIDGQDNGWEPAASVSFLFGAGLSAICGYGGMFIATEGNCRTAAACYSDRDLGLEKGLRVAFKTGACMGLGVVSCGIFGLTLCYAIFGNTQALGGFGFGSSAVALFARVGGGIYTKAADVGADLCGKVDKDLAEDSPKNPATIADCVGDNVGDVAGMGADLFESFVGAVVAAAVLGATEFGSIGVAYPFYIMMIGLVVSVACTVTISVSSKEEIPTLDELLGAMRKNILIAGVLIVIITLFLSVFLFEDISSDIDGQPGKVPKDQLNPGPRLFGCIALGLVVGILIGMVTEYFTSHTEEPTQSIGRATEFGPGPVIIQGLGMGMYSTVVPLLLIVAAILGSFYLCGFYGTAIATCGMLSTLGVTMSTDAYGPVSDNAGGIAEMSELPPWVRDYTDALDALGNTTAATGKGFANGSAVLSALALLTAYSRVAEIERVNLLEPVVVIGLLVGSLLPYVFGAMTMLSVNKAAQEMMAEVRRQFEENPAILTTDTPDYNQCVAISCNSSLREMLLPGVLAIFSPLVMGFIFGSHCLVGLLLGSISSGYLLGVKMSNTGGAWDNAKKWIEAGSFKINGVVQGKKTDCHKAAVCGDTVGDPFKDTSGPALNILIKLMTRFAFVCAPLFDDAWEYWWIGLILAGVALIFVALILFVVLKKDESADQVNEGPVADAEPIREDPDAAKNDTVANLPAEEKTGDMEDV